MTHEYRPRRNSDEEHFQRVVEVVTGQIRGYSNYSLSAEVINEKMRPHFYVGTFMTSPGNFSTEIHSYNRDTSPHPIWWRLNRLELPDRIRDIETTDFSEFNPHSPDVLAMMFYLNQLSLPAALIMFAETVDNPRESISLYTPSIFAPSYALTMIQEAAENKVRKFN